MRVEWHPLNSEERAAFWTAVRFLTTRLSDASTVEWALKLGPDRRAERSAISYLLHRIERQSLREPWTTVWGLIEESWHGQSNALYRASPGEIKRRVARGDRTGTVVSLISDLVTPWIEVRSNDRFDDQRAASPTDASHVVGAWLGPVRLVKPDDIGLPQIEEPGFLTALAHALEGQMRYGMDAARRIGWDGIHIPDGRLGRLSRVEWVRGELEGEDVDQLACRGITPCVKLLHAVVRRIAEFDPTSARAIVGAWGLFRTPFDVRLWAAAASDSSLVATADVERFLKEIDARTFWELGTYPEIATLRAGRFGELSHGAREQIAQRLVALPPTDLWSSRYKEEDLEEARLYWAIRELARIEARGGALPSSASVWLSENRVRFADLEAMSYDAGLPGGNQGRNAAPTTTPETPYDELHGAARLRVLEDALESPSEWGNDPAEEAEEWIRQPGHAADVLRDLQAATNPPAEFPLVWVQLCVAHSPTPNYEINHRESTAFLESLETLPTPFLRRIVNQVTGWMRTWSLVIANAPKWSRAWLRIWPMAVDSTNSYYQPEQLGSLDVQFPGSGEDMDAYNTPVAHMLGVFIAFLDGGLGAGRTRVHPFERGSDLRRMRDMLQTCEGQARLITRHRLIERLPLLLDADKSWARKWLVKPLQSSERENLALWRAVSRSTLRKPVLDLIGADVGRQAANSDLGVEPRERLMCSLICEWLEARYQERPPSMMDADLQHVLRSVDDAVRSHAAATVVRFLRAASQVADGSPERAFEWPIKPFMESVWPQDRTLVTPGISRAFAEMPVSSRESFAQAVHLVERYLTGFSCYSMMEFGFDWDDLRDAPDMQLINDKAKAHALLCLLAATVGRNPSDAVPSDLSQALARIREITPATKEMPSFRRLETVARRQNVRLH